ncbi:hypothetical protein PanWU01x14_004160 [Parasponia andersonii]|uniref:Uncharacterized protein n=1 Tax=Parasponia andersonii TaxID=3476 RepID=A0A2P5E336_PARAD|nr:hypothetical protein PanWU01x14_004160 [Parasponia andersonii]
MILTFLLDEGRSDHVAVSPFDDFKTIYLGTGPSSEDGATSGDRGSLGGLIST